MRSGENERTISRKRNWLYEKDGIWFQQIILIYALLKVCHENFRRNQFSFELFLLLTTLHAVHDW